MNNNSNAINQEQAICIQCGLCCNGALFLKANSTEEEEKIYTKDFGFIKIDDRYFFELPCKYFSDSGCIIYSTCVRPKVCSSFVCKLIRKCRRKEIDFQNAMGIAAKAVKMHRQLIDETNNFDELKGLPAKKLAKILNHLKLESLDEATYRRRYFRVLIFHDFFCDFIVKHFYKKTETGSKGKLKN